MHINILNSIRN